MSLTTYFHVFTMKNICILGAVHQDLWPLPLLVPSAVPPTLLPLAHGSPLTACIPHDSVFL